MAHDDVHDSMADLNDGSMLRGKMPEEDTRWMMSAPES